MDVEVYINWGRFIAECPCGDAREVEPGQRMEACVDGHVMDLQWPDDAPQVMAVLGERISAKRRNWFPAGHEVAIRLGQPHGQSLDDLRQEADEGEAADSAWLAERRAYLLAELHKVGVSTEDSLNALKGS